MAQIPFRANTQSMAFPLLSELSGRTVIVPQQDQTFVPGLSPGSDQTQIPVDRGAPALYYCHNVMPSTYGWQSVGYDIAYEGIDWQGRPVTPLNFKGAQLIQGGTISGDRPVSSNFKTYISIPAVGNNPAFMLNPVNKNWRVIAGAPTTVSTTRITVATVNGVSYIFFSGIGAYIYDNTTNSLINRPLTGLDVSKVLGIVSANGYLFAYTSDSVAWSSVVNVEDFVVSDVSGAGGGTLQEAKGTIVTASATVLGLIIYTTANAVSVIYSGNADFPWNFKSIPASGGISDPDLVSAEQTGGFQQVYTTNGLQQIGHNGARTVYPFITDFISGNLFEDFDLATNQLVTTRLTTDMEKGLAVVADRYIIMSYGAQLDQLMTHAIVLDVAQNRMGKLKVAHSYCFELRSLDTATTETPRGSTAFLHSDGTIRVVNFNTDKEAPDSVMLMGKFQYVRQRMLELFSVELENIMAGVDFELQALPSLNGKNFSFTLDGYTLDENPNYRNFSFDGAVGTNITLLMKGRFNLNTVLLWFAPHGRR